jgi:hypothetical protein
MDNDPTLFEECCKKFEEDGAKEGSMRSKREARYICCFVLGIISLFGRTEELIIRISFQLFIAYLLF